MKKQNCPWSPKTSGSWGSAGEPEGNGSLCRLKSVSAGVLSSCPSPSLCNGWYGFGIWAMLPLGVEFLAPRLVCPFPGRHGELSRHKVDVVVIEQALLELLLYLRES